MLLFTQGKEEMIIVTGFDPHIHRHDPYESFKFRVILDGMPIMGVSKVSALQRVTDVIEHRAGGDLSSIGKSPGITQYEPVTLERGITQDRVFEQWADKVWKLGGESSPSDFRKDVAIEVLDETDQVVFRYLLYRCWVSAYEALPELDANVDTIAVERITLEHEGWERDASLHPP